MTGWVHGEAPQGDDSPLSIDENGVRGWASMSSVATRPVSTLTSATTGC